MAYRRHKKTPSLAWALIVALFVVLRWYFGGDLSSDPPTVLQPGVYRVRRVVDGDTLVLANEGRVRLIGANTPETVRPNHPVEPWGPEATEFTRRLVAGRDVRLEMDGRRTDKYGRFLAHVWIDDKWLGEELVRAGLAKAETSYHFSADRKKRLVAAQEQARLAERGIWSR